MNYDLEMEKQMNEYLEGTTLLLHACCAPCSSAVLERLGNYFKITIYYYNPNITDYDEYLKRISELKRFISSFTCKYPIDLIEGKYEPEKFTNIARGLEKEPERGIRCYKCYELRLRETAILAKEINLSLFATTIKLYPYKKNDWIKELEEKLDKEYHTTYLYSDFKKKNGYKRSIELSKEYDLYRQDYCGCIYSKLEKQSH